MKISREVLHRLLERLSGESCFELMRACGFPIVQTLVEGKLGKRLGRAFRRHASSGLLRESCRRKGLLQRRIADVGHLLHSTTPMPWDDAMLVHMNSDSRDNTIHDFYRIWQVQPGELLWSSHVCDAQAIDRSLMSVPSAAKLCSSAPTGTVVWRIFYAGQRDGLDGLVFDRPVANVSIRFKRRSGFVVWTGTLPANTPLHFGVDRELPELCWGGKRLPKIEVVAQTFKGAIPEMMARFWITNDWARLGRGRVVDLVPFPSPCDRKCALTFNTRSSLDQVPCVCLCQRSRGDYCGFEMCFPKEPASRQTATLKHAGRVG